MKPRFNVRVYGILIHNGRLLVNEELIKTRTIIKLPGGGLDYGEGTTDCVIREWKEELDIDITVLEHFYTTDFFVASAFDDSQVISIYYLVTVQVPDVLTNHVANERTYWVDLQEVSADTFTLVIDKRVGEMLKERFVQGV